MFLNGADFSTPTEPGALEQVAELVPLPESSLALAATLWDVPSDSPTSTLHWHPLNGNATDSNARTDAVSSWVLFMTGVDQALEQTCRDIQENIPSARGRNDDEASLGSPEQLLEWQGAILPAARHQLPATQPIQPEPGHGRSETSGPAGQGRTPTGRGSETLLEDDGPAAVGVVPTISIVSVSSLIAGWFWRKRGQWPRSRHRRTVARSHGSRGLSLKKKATQRIA